MITSLLTLFVMVALYFLPTIIAERKHKKNKGAIFLTNTLLGWTGLGWIVCLIWSTMND